MGQVHPHRLGQRHGQDHADRAGQADRHDAARLVTEMADILPRLLHRPQDAAGVGDQDRAALGGRDPARRAHQQFDTEVLLEMPDMLAQRRLGDPEALGGARDGSFLRDGQKVPELTDVHGTPPSGLAPRSVCRSDRREDYST